MKNISLQRITLFFVGVYSLIAMWPLRLTFLNSFIPGQLIPIFFIALLSLLDLENKSRIFKNIDIKIIFFFMLFILLNTSIQGVFNPHLIEYRISSLIASLIPILIFFIFISIDITEDFFRIVSRYLFIGSLFYVAFYFESFLFNRLTEEPHVASMGQRDSIYLNFALLMAVFRNYHLDHFFYKILGFLSAACVLFILVYSQTRGGYVLLGANILALSYIYKKYFFSIFLPFIVLAIVVYIIYFTKYGTIHDLIHDFYKDTSSWEKSNNFEILRNQIRYSIVSFNSLVDSFLSFFSSEFELSGSFQIRFMIWDKILDFIAQSPFTIFFGFGEIGVQLLDENLLVKSPSALFPVVWPLNNAESQIFDTLFRRGIIGIIFLFTIVFRFAYLANYLRKYDNKIKDIALVFLIWIIGYSFVIFFLPLMRDRILVIFFFTFYAVFSSRVYKIKTQTN